MSTIRAVYLGRHETSSFTEKATSSCWSLEEKLVERLESLQLAAKSTKQRVEADAMTSSSSEVVEEDEEEEQKVLVEVSRHGLKISSQRSRLVQCRIPMLELLLVTSYRDGFGRTNVGVVERAPNRFHLHVLQLPDDVTAHKLCALVKEVFVEAEEVNALIDTIEPPSPSLV